MQIHFLIRMAAVVVRRDVARDHEHRHRNERRVGDAGGRIGQPRAEVRQHDARLTGDARVAVRGVSGDLFVARRDETDPALAQRIEQRNHGVTAQAEDHLDADPFQVVGQLVRRDPHFSGAGVSFDGGLGDCAHDDSRYLMMLKKFVCCKTRRIIPVPTGDPLQSAG